MDPDPKGALPARPWSAAAALGLLGVAAILPCLQLALGSAPIRLWAAIPALAGLAINGTLAVLLLKPRMWAIVLNVLRGLGGVVFSWVKLKELRWQWGEWNFHHQAAAMTWLLIGLVVSALLVVALLLPPTLRWGQGTPRPPDEQ